MKSSVVLQKKKQKKPLGRSGVYDPIMSLRMPLALKAKVKDWAKTQSEKLSMSKAICRLVEHALGATESAEPPKALRRPAKGGSKRE